MLCLLLTKFCSFTIPYTKQSWTDSATEWSSGFCLVGCIWCPHVHIWACASVHLCIWWLHAHIWACASVHLMSPCPHGHDSDLPYLTLLQGCHILFCIIFCRLQVATEGRIISGRKGKKTILFVVSTCDIICLQLWKNCCKYNNNSACKISKWQDVLGKSNKLANWDDDSSKHLLTTISFPLRLTFNRDNHH